MRLLSTLGASLVVGVIVSAIAGCVVDSTSSGSGGSASPAPTSTTPPSTNYPLLSLDTGRSLTATPGDGAGVFVTYQAGGHWSLQWTCDTNSSGYSCAFEVSVTASTGAITNYVPVPQAATVTQNPGTGTFTVDTETASTLDGVTFDTPPGAPIIFSATINGRPMPNLVFYVSNGKLVEAPTDPVEFVPTSP